jgi:hypothetical protein
MEGLSVVMGLREVEVFEVDADGCGWIGALVLQQGATKIELITTYWGIRA